MKKVLILKGLPASGKTTYAKALVAEGWKRVNKDDLRDMLDGGKYTKGNENFVLNLRDQIILDAIEKGRNVVIDDTNFHSKHEKRIKEIVGNRAKVEVKLIECDVNECIERDRKRVKSVGKNVIIEMWERYLKPKSVGYDSLKDDCYIFDIDGTLALKGDRSPFDWGKVENDHLNGYVASVFEVLRHSDDTPTMILLSGRDSICRKATEGWLDHNGLNYDFLYMRSEGDNRKDWIVKKELYEAHIKGDYNVLGIFDDRPQMIRGWRSLGLPVFDVGPGYEF